MKITTYNMKGEKAGSIEVSDRVFGARWSSAVVKQVYDGERANARRPWAHTKTRGEVRGGGKKPWRQKGLGRARHGSSRSPIWVGGGVSHGPRNDRDYSVKINKKMKAASLRTLLSKKLKEGELIVLDAFQLSQNKTKEVAIMFKNLQNGADIKRIGTLASTLVSFPHKETTIRACRNLPKVSYIEPRNINTTSLLHSKFVVFDVDALKELEKVTG
jgi:large subunit ribosomal protein L4